MRAASQPSGRDNWTIEANSLGELGAICPKRAAALRQAMMDARTMTEKAMVALDPANEVATLILVDSFAVGPAAAKNEMPELKRRLSEVRQFLTRLQGDPGRIGTGSCPFAGVLAIYSPSRDKVVVMEPFFELPSLGQALALIHESAHGAIGGEDCFYLPSSDFKSRGQPLPEVTVIELKKYRQRFMASVVNEFFWMSFIHDEKQLMRLTEENTLEAAMNQFRCDPRKRVSVLLQNPDTLALMTHLLAQQRR